MMILISNAPNSLADAELRVTQAGNGVDSAYAHASAGEAGFADASTATTMTAAPFTKVRSEFGGTLPVGDTAWFCNQIAKKYHSQQRERST